MIVVLVSLFGAGWYFSSQVISPEMKAYDETYRMEVEAGKIIERDFKALRRRSSI